MQRPWHHVTPDQNLDRLNEISLVGHTPEKFFGRGFTGFFVAVGRHSSVRDLGMRCLAKIVTKDSKANPQILLLVTGAPFSKRIKAMPGVNPNIALGMPLGFLGNAFDRSQLREIAIPSSRGEKLEPLARHFCFENQFLPFLLETLA